MASGTLNHRKGIEIPSRCPQDRREPIGENEFRHFVLFPEDGLSGGSGVWVSVPERSLWLPPTEASFLVGVFFPADLLIPELLLSPAPEDRLFDGTGV